MKAVILATKTAGLLHFVRNDGNLSFAMMAT
jgi:hypothetical protein